MQLEFGTHFEETLFKTLHMADATGTMFYALWTDKLITGCEKLLNYPGDYVENSVPVTLSFILPVASSKILPLTYEYCKLTLQSTFIIIFYL